MTTIKKLKDLNKDCLVVFGGANAEINMEDNKVFFSGFLESAYQFCKLKKEKTEVVTYIFKTGYWQQLSKLPKREVETLHLPNDLLKENINDLEKFLNGREEYIKYGIPYKRNYLFEGIPGTGKTSFIFVLASYFNMIIAIITPIDTLGFLL